MQNDIPTRNDNVDELIYNNMPISVVKTDLDGNILYVNNSFVNSSGYSYKELIGKNTNVLKSGEMSDTFYSELWQTISSGNDWIGKICNKRKNGIFYWQELRIRPMLDDNGNILYYLGIAIDVTSDMLLVEKLTEKSIMNDKMFSVMPNIVYIFDIYENKNIYYNKMLSTLTGYSSSEIYNNKNSIIELLIHPDDISYFLAHVERIKNGDIFKTPNSAFSMEYRLVGKYGDIINIIDKQIPFKYNSAGKVEHIMGVVIDITEIKEKHSIIENSNEVKDRLLSILAHDIKNPFQAIVGYSDLIHYSYEINNSEELLLYLTKLQEVVFDIDELLGNIISWARINNLKPNKIKIKLDEFIEYILSKYHSSFELKKITCNRNIGSDLYLYVDEYMAQSIIGNFITNAIKFTNTNGSISITAKLANYGDRISFEIEDNGIGMNTSILNSIYNKEFVSDVTIGTNGEKGTGLGMSICKEFIKKHDGRLYIDSKLGRGTIIKFDLPGFKKM